MPFPPFVPEWTKDKTPATVSFVQEAELALSVRADIDEREKYQLQTLVQMMKIGDAALDERESVDEWLERLRDHYP